MFNVTGTLQNVMDGKVTIVAPGFGKKGISITQPKDKDYLLLVLTDKDGKAQAPMTLPLLPGYAIVPDGIKAKAVDGIITIEVKYDRGSEITVTGDDAE